MRSILKLDTLSTVANYIERDYGLAERLLYADHKVLGLAPLIWLLDIVYIIYVRQVFGSIRPKSIKDRLGLRLGCTHHLVRNKTTGSEWVYGR